MEGMPIGEMVMGFFIGFLGMIVGAVVALLLEVYVRIKFGWLDRCNPWVDRIMRVVLAIVMASGAYAGYVGGSLMELREVAQTSEWKKSLVIEDIVVTDIEVFMQYRFVTTPEHPERLVVRYPSMANGEDVAVGKRYRVWRDKSYVHFIEEVEDGGAAQPSSNR
jgi:hypothetical protein